MDAKNVPTDLYLQQLRALGAWWRLGSSVLRPQLLVESLTDASLAGRGGVLNIPIVAATGGVGRQILEQAEAAGHHVTAVVRNPAKLPATRNGLRVVSLDLAAPDAEALQSAIGGADAVLSGLGAVSAAEAGVA